MAVVDIFDHQKQVTEQMELDDSVYSAPVNDTFLHQVLVSYQANKRQGTSLVKNRNTVSGTKSKPFRQKGTGRARQGTMRAPHHRGGATQFGPVPRSYRKRIPKKMKQLAFRQCLSLKRERGELFVLTDLDFAEIQTKQASSILRSFETNGRTLFVDADTKPNAYLSFRNLAQSRYMPMNICSPLDIFESDYLFITKEAADLFQKRYAKEGAEDHAE